MFSLTTPNSVSLSNHHHNHRKSLFSSTFLNPLPNIFNFPSSTTSTTKPSLSKAISAKQPSPPPIGIIHATGSTQPPQNLYQPFRPPPSPLPPQYRNLDTAGRIEILSNRLGQWFEYAPLIAALLQEGFTPSTVEELTGITGADQNRLVVAQKVRASLVESSQLSPETLSYFDNGGAELLYEIRLLSTSQRAAVAEYLVSRKLDGDSARDIARAIKDFPRRKKDTTGWDCFDYNKPGDILAFMYYRQSKEHYTQPEKRSTALQKALEAVESDIAREKLLEEIEGKAKDSVSEELEAAVVVPVVRLKIGEVAEATSVVVLPVCRADDKDSGVMSAPFESRTEGEFGVVVSDKSWDRWVVLPSWDPVIGLQKGGVVVSFVDARVLPWKVNKSYMEEAILVVADRGRKEVTADDGIYLVVKEGDDGLGEGLKVVRGTKLKETGIQQSLGTVVMIIRPPKDEVDDQLNDEDWD